MHKNKNVKRSKRILRIAVHFSKGTAMTYYGKLKQLLQWRGAPAIAATSKPITRKTSARKPKSLSEGEQKGVNESAVKLRRGRETLERHRLL
jgi:hypothetical protein